MRTLSYQGSARERRRGFNPLKVPDQTQKYREEAERQLQHMKEYAEQDLKNRTAVQEGLEENARIEENFHEEVGEIDETFRKAYHEAEMQHYKQRLADVKEGGGLWLDSKNKQKKLDDDWKRLGELIPKAVGLAGQYAKHRDEKLKLYGIEVATRHGLSGRELAAIKNGDRQVGWVHAAFKSIEHKLENSSAEERRAVYGLSGRALLGAQGYAISTVGTKFEPWLIKNGSVQFAEGIGSYNDHMKGIDGTSTSSGRVLIREAKKAFVREHLGYEDPETGEWNLSYDTNFINAHLTPRLNKSMEKFEAEIELKQATKLGEEQQKEQETAFKYYLKGFGGSERGNAVQRWINEETSNGKLPNRALKKAQAFDIMARLASSGEMTRTEWADIKNSNIVLGDATKGGKPQRLGTVWADNAAVVEKAFDERDKLWEARRADSRKVFDAQMKQEAAVALSSMGRNFTKFDIENIENLYLGNGYQPSQWVLKLKNATEQSIEDSKYNLDALVADDSLTMAELYSGKYHGSVLKTYEKHTTNGPGSIPSESKSEYIGAIRNAVTSKVNGIIVDSKLANSQSKIQTGRAIKILTDRVKIATIQGKYENATEAWAEESNQLRKEIENGEGIFAPKKSGGVELVGREGGFADLDDPLDYDRKGVRYRAAASEDKMFIWKKEQFSQAEVTQLKEVRAGGAMPNWAHQIAESYPEKDVIDVANAILLTAGEKPLERQGLSKVKDYTHPAMHRLITKFSSQARTNRALNLTQIRAGQVPTAEAELGIQKSKAVMAADPDGGYDAVTSSRGMSSGKLNYNTPLTEMTVTNITDLQRREGIKAGAYQFDLKVLNYYINKGPHYLDPNEKFTQEVQDRIKRWEILRTSGEFDIIDANGQLRSVPGLGHNTDDWEALDPDTDERVKMAIASLGGWEGNNGFEAWKLKPIFGGIA